MHWQRRLATAVAASSSVFLADAHYGQPPCQSDESLGEVQGANGNLCAPQCSQDGYNCPTDIPGLANAQPLCMLQDVNKHALCGLLCQVDSQCPSGSQCKTIKQMEVGICLYPISFADWARQGNTEKLAIGWPSQSGQPLAFQLAKTQQALQSMKTKYSIDDGDSDLVILKDLLVSLKAPSGSGGGANPAAEQSSSSSQGEAPISDVGLTHDVTKFAEYASEGLPGFEREVHDTVWNIEHIEHRNAATHLMTGLLWIIFLYLGVGGIFKYQQGARGFDMIPHLEFWAEYPRLVTDGLIYAKILLGITPIDGSISGGLSGAPRGGAGAFEKL